MNLPEFSVRNSIFGNMLTIAVLIAGLYAAFTITRELFPLTDLGIVVVKTIYRNASPAEVENHITIPLEEEIRGIDGIDEFISVSSESISSIVITLDPDEEDNKERIINNISRKVDRLKLPSGVEKPDINVLSGGNEVIHVSISGDVSEDRRREVADILKSRIEAIQGVGKVEKTGWRDPEIWVEVDPEALIKNELSLVRVAESIAGQNVNMPGGKMQSESKDTILRTVGEFTSLEDVESVVVRSNSDGRHLTVGDIGSVRNAFADDAMIVRADGSRAIILNVKKQLSGDTIDIADKVKKLVDEAREEMQDGVKIGVLDFESYVIKRRLKVLLSNGLMGLILVLCALPLVLNFRLAFVTAMGIPFAFLVTILVMACIGISINMITMFGIILVVGMLVDDAIIVAENVYRHIEMGKTPYQAAIDGTGEVMWPVTVTILTTIAAFVPMLYLPGIMGKFLKWVPIVVIITLSASLFEALVILPCHISEFVRSPGKDVDKKKGEVFWNVLRSGYARLLKRVLGHRIFFIILIVVTLGGAFFLASRVMYVDQFPADLIEIFTVNISTPEGTTRQATEERTAFIERKITGLLKDNELKNLITHVGHHTDLKGVDVQVGARYSTIFVYLTPPAERKRSVPEIINALRESCAGSDGIQDIAFEMVKGGPPVGKAVDIKIVGEDYEKLDELAEEMKASLRTYPGVEDVKDDHDVGKEELVIVVNKVEAARLGVDVASVARTIYSGFEGIVATSVRNAEEETKVRIRLAPPYRNRVEYLLNLRVPNHAGRLIEIGKIAELTKARTATSLFHYNGERAVSVTASVTNREKNKKTVAMVNNDLWEQFSGISKRHPGYRIARTGEWKDRQEMTRAMWRAAFAAVLMIYTILVIQFKSFAQPFSVLASIPFGMIGVVLALILHGKPISMMAMMGMVGLCGVVVNDAIVLVSFINDLRLQGVPVHEAVPRAAETRLRPILLTSLTTVLGLAPVIYGIGGYEPFVAPAAIVLAYGLVFATGLTLLVVPCLYSIGVDIGEKLGLSTYWRKYSNV